MHSMCLSESIEADSATTTLDHLEVVRTLFEAGADLNAVNQTTYESPLEIAIVNHDTELIRCLHGACSLADGTGAIVARQGSRTGGGGGLGLELNGPEPFVSAIKSGANGAEEQIRRPKMTS